MQEVQDKRGKIEKNLKCKLILLMEVVHKAQVHELQMVAGLLPSTA